MTDPNLNITETLRLVGSTTLFEFECEQGILDATLNPNGWFGIANVTVDVMHRRKGIGKMLLRHAAEKAEQVDAKFVYAAITSRECLDAMVSVFGEEVVTIENKGSYADEFRGPEDLTSAALWLPRD